MKSSQLIQHWVHSHEEDSAGQMVFRPAKFKFPPSRGRASFELRANGSLVDHGIGATDAPTTATGKWRETPGGRIELFHKQDAKPSRVFKLVRVAKDQLVVQQPDGASP